MSPTLSAAHGDLEMQAPVVRRRHRVREAGAEGVIRLAQPLLQQPSRPDVAAGLLIVGQMQLDAAVELDSVVRERLKREQRVGVGREVGLAHGNAAAIHHAAMFGILDDGGAVGIMRPAQTGRDDIAMRVERDAGPVLAEALAHDEVGGRDHADRGHVGFRHREALDIETEAAQPARRGLGVRGAITRRVVGRNLDHGGEEGGLGREMSIDPVAHESPQGNQIHHSGTL